MTGVCGCGCVCVCIVYMDSQSRDNWARYTSTMAQAAINVRKTGRVTFSRKSIPKFRNFQWNILLLIHPKLSLKIFQASPFARLMSPISRCTQSNSLVLKISKQFRERFFSLKCINLDVYLSLTHSFSLALRLDLATFLYDISFVLHFFSIVV